MKHISSRDNPLYKQFMRAMRGKRGTRTLIEGIHLCQEWLRHKGSPVQALFDLERLRHDQEVAALAAALPSDIETSCEPVLARGLSQVQENQGVYFLVDVPHDPLPSAIIGTSLWLDRIQDPGNVGTLLRTAAAAGVTSVFLSVGCAGVWTPKVLRSGQGAHFVLDIYENVDLAALHVKLEVPLIATSLQNAVSLYDTSLPPDCAWLLGNEGQGVADDLLVLADQRVYIPQSSLVESLNVAVAAAVCLFEHQRQRISS